MCHLYIKSLIDATNIAIPNLYLKNDSDEIIVAV